LLITGQIFAVDRGYFSSTRSFGGEHLNLGLRQGLYRSIVWCEKYFEILNRMGMAYECDGLKERRTDGQEGFRNSAL